MTTEEKMIVSSYTGVLMVDARDFRDWSEKYLGYEVQMHELATADFWMRMKEKSENDFWRLCGWGNDQD